MTVEAMMLADLTRAVYELKDAVERNTEAAEKLAATMRAQGVCKNCGHEIETHVLTNGVQQGTCVVEGCSCIHYEAAT